MANCANCGNPVTANNGNGYKSDKFPNEIFCSPECLNDYSSKKSLTASLKKEYKGETIKVKDVAGALFRETLIGGVVSGVGDCLGLDEESRELERIEREQRKEKQEQEKEKQEKLCNASFGDDPTEIVDILHNLSLEIRNTYKNELLISEEDKETRIKQYYQKYEQGLQRLQLLSADNNTAKISYEEAKAEFDKIQKEITEDQAKQKKQERRHWIIIGILFVVGIVFTIIKG